MKGKKGMEGKGRETDEASLTLAPPVSKDNKKRKILHTLPTHGYSTPSPDIQPETPEVRGERRDHT